MPTTRRKVVRFRRASGLTAEQRQHLECGHDYFGDGKPFASERARRDSWTRHRRAVLRAWDGPPGTRPQGYWDYDAIDAVERFGGEAAAVLALGLADARERRLVELAWLRELELVILMASRPELELELAVGRGIPAEFAAKHLPALRAAAELARGGKVVDMHVEAGDVAS